MIKKDAPIIVRKSYTYKVPNVPKNGSATVTVGDLGITAPAGYAFCGVYGAFCSNTDIIVAGFRAVGTSSAAALYLRNISAAAITNVNVNLYLTFVREDVAGYVDTL